MLPPFRNEPLTDFAQAENQKKMEAALQKVAQEFNREYPLVIGGEKITVSEKLRSYNPSRKEQVVGTVQKGSKEHALKALDAAWKAFDTWKHRDVAERADYLVRMASAMRERKFELSAWMVSRSARAGSRRTPTWPRRSTSASSTRARCSATARPMPCVAVAGREQRRSSTSRSASARSSRRGTSRWRSWSA